MENSNKEHWNNPQPVREDNKKLAAGILALLLAPFGFISSWIYRKDGMVFTCGSVTTLLGFIEGIIYLTKSDDEFQTYQANKKVGSNSITANLLSAGMMPL
jgi:hypothetical protein